jgi:hypothetical protein
VLSAAVFRFSYTNADLRIPAPIALCYWSRAIILEGVYARYTAGGYGKVDEGVHYFARMVERLAEAADQAERRS